MKNLFYCLCFILTSLLFNSLCYAHSNYFICGSNKNKCRVDQVESCMCIPYNEVNNEKPYCLDMKTMRCEPFSSVPSCPSTLMFEDQGSCLGMLYQHEPDPCETVSQEFCRLNNVSMCDVSGDPRTCKK